MSWPITTCAVLMCKFYCLLVLICFLPSHIFLLPYFLHTHVIVEGSGAAETNNKTESSQSIAWELANKLQENAQHIHTILNEEATEYADEDHALPYSMSPDAMETTRQKADELIKSLGGLLDYLNGFTELIKESGFENVGMT
jgi:hypothetical protein